MSFTRPTLAELADRISSDIEARFPGADSRLRHSVLGTLARVTAGAMHGLYGHLDFLADQLLPDSAESEYLRRWGGVYGVTIKAATAAAGSAAITGTNDTLVEAGTLLQRGDGVEYATTADAVIAAGVATLLLDAVLPGAAGSAVTGVKLTFVSPIAGIGAEAVVAEPGLIGGEDEETDDAYRARLLARIRQPPQGGARSDYERWGLEVAGVTRVWVYPEWLGAGTVGVTFVMDGREDPIPLAGDVEIVAAYLDPLRPVTAEVVVFAPTPEPLDLEISGLDPDNAETQAAVAEEIRDLLFREAAPGGTILISHLREAISVAAGERDHVLVSPIANIAHAPGHLATLGEITWT